jgi:S-formylglutathione hydrolase FrmB
VTQDLVQYIDSHYRTLTDRESRGLAGHSMGGYGTLRIAMKHPEVYASIYAMSSCCLMNNPGAARPPAPARAPAPPAPAAATSGETAAAPGRGRGGRGGGFANVQSAQAAAWSPNPQNPPKFFDLPVQDGNVRPEIAAKWIANSPLAMVDQYAANLKKLRVMMDVGLQDGLAESNKEMDASLNRLNVSHTFETYEGDHTNRVKERFETRVLPFFSESLKFSSGAR